MTLLERHVHEALADLEKSFKKSKYQAAFFILYRDMCRIASLTRELKAYQDSISKHRSEMHRKYMIKKDKHDAT